jgi:hypothetical protein
MGFLPRAGSLALAGLGLATGLAAGLANAGEIWRSGEAYIDLGGTVREIALVSRGTSPEAFGTGLAQCFPPLVPAVPDPAEFANCPAFGAVGEKRVATSTTRLRLRMEARANRHWSAVISIDNEFLAGTLDTFEANIGAALAGRDFFDASGQIGEDPVAYRYSLYRGYLNFESKHLEAAVGRQRIPWGVGRLWNPIDRFNAIRPLALQPGESPGVDAINARILFSDFSQLQLVFAPGRDAQEHKYAARLQGMARNIDYGLVAGVFNGAMTLGADFSGNLGDAAGRAEIVYTRPGTGADRNVWPVGAPGAAPLDDFWQLVVSVDYNIDWGSGVYVLAEHLYNGNALGFGFGLAGPLLGFFEQTTGIPYYAATSADRFGGSQVITRSSQLTGLQVGYELTPELRLSALVIYDWEGESAVFFPSVAYSPLAWLDLTLGLQTTAGGRYSEFGDAPTTGYLLADFYF